MLMPWVPEPYTEKPGPKQQYGIYNFYNKIKSRGSLEYYQEK